MGGSQTDVNGITIEELMDERRLLCLNDGRGTKLNWAAGNDDVGFCPTAWGV